MSNEKIDLAMKELWERAKAIFLSTLRSDEEKSQATRYFSMITSVCAEDGVFKILTLNSFAADFLKTEYADRLKTCLDLAGGDKSLSLAFLCSPSAQPPIILPPSPTAAAAPSRAVSMFISTMPLNDDYTFDEFVEGPSNSYAYAAAKGVAEHPGEIGFNPLFIHGGTGLGKTHLMQAIGNEVHRKNPNLAVCYLTTETFLNEYVNSLQKGRAAITEFQNKYRKIDVLLVDDVQFLQKGKQFQEEFFNTFNALKDAHKQIVMTSDVAPKNLSVLEERLISRFEGGMVQEIESPSYETRLAILQKKADGITPVIPDYAIRFIADRIKSHVRAMEGALAKIKIAMLLNPGVSLTNEMMTRALKDLIEKEHNIKKLTIREIQEAVARKYGVTIEQILSPERTQSLVTPRQLAMYISRKYSSKSLQEISEPFGKTHATVLHGVKAITKRLDVEEELRETLRQILNEFGINPDDTVN
jgi:chromosomal replication initiator protein